MPEVLFNNQVASGIDRLSRALNRSEKEKVERLIKLLANGDEIPDNYHPKNLSGELRGSIRCKIGRKYRFIFHKSEGTIIVTYIGPRENAY